MIDRLHYISQETADVTHLQAIEKVLEAGGRWIQLRVKNKDEATTLKIAEAAAELCNRYNARLIINDYPEIALKVGAYGVHLGLGDMSVAEARAILSYHMVIGGTANTFEHVLQRVNEGANYIGLGPYRFTATKQNLSPIIGLEGYKTIISKVRQAGIDIPIIAIGGILADDVKPLAKEGLFGVAVSTALSNSDNCSSVLRQIYDSFDIQQHSTEVG